MEEQNYVLSPQREPSLPARPSEKREVILTRHTGAKFVRKFRYQVVVDPILHGAQDNHWPSVVYCREEEEEADEERDTEMTVKLPKNKNCRGHYCIG